MNRHIKEKGKNKNNKGFYIALGICLIAVGVAAWTTYDSVVNYAVPENSGTSSKTAQANNTVSGIYASESKASSKPAVSSKAASKAPQSSAPSSKVSHKKAVSKTSVKQTAAKPEVYSYPVGKVIIQKFSENPVYCKTTDDWRAHTGIDLKADAGTAVKSIAEGKVKKVYDDDRYGNTVIITHGDIEAWYCGLDKTEVKAGDTVTSGQEIGTVGVVPIEKYEDSHLHFVTMENGKYVDPLKILNG